MGGVPQPSPMFTVYMCGLPASLRHLGIIYYEKWWIYFKYESEPNHKKMSLSQACNPSCLGGSDSLFKVCLFGTWLSCEALGETMPHSPNVVLGMDWRVSSLATRAMSCSSFTSMPLTCVYKRCVFAWVNGLEEQKAVITENTISWRSLFPFYSNFTPLFGLWWRNHILHMKKMGVSLPYNGARLQHCKLITSPQSHGPMLPILLIDHDAPGFM